MSLIHWWPLIEDFKDYGGVSSIRSGTFEQNSYGKIGTCFKSTSPGVQTSCKLLDEWNHWEHSVSMSCWIKLNYDECNNYVKSLSYSASNNKTNGTGCVIGQTSYGGLGIYWRTSNAILSGGNVVDLNSINFYGFTRGTSGNVSTSAFTATFDEWHHLVLVADYSSKILRLYVDGSQIGGDVSYASVTAKTDVRYFGIGRSEVYGGNGPGGCLPMYVNDVRLYDHALSQAEAKELSKALVMHHTFDDILTKPTTNLLPASQQTQSNSAATINVTSGLVSGATYTLSTYITRDPACTSTNPRLTLRFFYSDGTNTSVSKYSDGGASYPKDGVERYYFITATANPAKTLTSVGGWLMDHSSGSGKKMTATRSQLEISAYPTPYTPTTRESMLVDEAGLSEVTNTRNVDLSENAASGQYSLQSNDTWIKTMSNSQYQRDITLSAWVNPASFGGDCIIIGGCYLTVTGAGKLSAYCYGKNPAGYHTGSTVMSVGTWYHLAVVWDGSTCVGYINGEQEFTKSSTGSADSSPNHLKKDIGSENGTSRKFNGLIDDVRIYHTALSADDIKDLYSAKAYITNEGDIETHQFIEKTENIITEAEFAIPAKSSAGNGKIEMRNGVMAYGLQASTYYYSGDSESSNAIFKGKFKANTQYYFDLFMDVDTMWYSGGSRYVPGGLVIRYTDGTSAEVTAQSTDGANGWKRVQYYSDPAKSIYGLGVYYYIGTKWYLRHDSGIYEVDKDNAQITSKYTAETTQVTETSFETNALIHSSGNVVGRETIEI